jgi:hypothetical protein
MQLVRSSLVSITLSQSSASMGSSAKLKVGDEPLNLVLEVLFRRALTVGPIVPLLNCLDQALE